VVVRVPSAQREWRIVLLEKIAQLIETRSNLLPQRMRSVAEQSTLLFVGGGNLDRKPIWRKERVTVGEAHVAQNASRRYTFLDLKGQDCIIGCATAMIRRWCRCSLFLEHLTS
jgi:hypothetical protein